MPSTTTGQITSSIIAQIKEKQELDEDAVVSLHRIFQHAFLEALDLIDRGKRPSTVTQFTHQGRDFIQVAGSDKVYQVHLDLMDLQVDTGTEVASVGISRLGLKVSTIWCSCEGFLARNLMPVEEQMCEHILAALLAIGLGKLPGKTCNNHEIYSSFFDDL